MVRKALRKCIEKHVKVLPMPVLLSPEPHRVGYEWFVHRNSDGLLITVSLGNGITLQNDHIHQYTEGTDGSAGTLILTGQIYIHGPECWLVPVVGRPGTEGPLHPTTP